MINTFIVVYYLAACFTGCYINILVKQNTIPVYLTLISNLLFMGGWMFSIKNSSLPLTKLTALVNVTITFGYFFGLAYFGERITPIQWSGVMCLIVGIILINK
jgi:drug/metabolite transporter (DMT)-like permease